MVSNTSPTEDDALRFDFAPLRRRRRLLEISQKRLSKKVGAHDNAVLYWESGKSLPSLKQFYKTARVLGMPLADIVDVYDQTDNPLDFTKRPR